MTPRWFLVLPLPTLSLHIALLGAALKVLTQLPHF